MWGWNEATWFAMFAGLAFKSTVVLGAAWLAAFLLRGRSAAARHLVWTAAAAAVLALPLLSVSLPALRVPAAAVLVPNISVVFQTTATARADAGAAKQTGVAKQARPAATWRPDWPLWLMLLWTAGAAALFLQMLVACAGMWRARRRAMPSPDRRLLLELARGLGIRYSVEVFETPAGAMPMTFGILRPAIFIPGDAAGWTEDLRRIVLLHELAHVRRGDVATQLLARLSLILNWWNPLAWMAWRGFLNERERATDDLVLQAGARASDYAGHLLEVARSRHAAPALAWAAVAMARRSQLEGRLVAILDSRVKRRSAGRASALAAVLAAVAIVAPLAAVRAQSDVQTILRAATSQEKPETPAAPAAALAAREQPAAASGSAAYGVGLLKIADLEKTRHRPQEADAFYTKALSVLGDRAEAAPALMYLGIHRKDPAEAMDYLQRAERLDPAQAGPARMWMALIRERQQNPAEADRLFQSALEAQISDPAGSSNTIHLYSRFLRHQGREQEAKAMDERLAQVRGAANNTHAVRVGGDVKAPALLAKVEPEYSEEARAAKYQGTVVIYVEVGADGMAHNMRVVKGLGLGLDEKALEAINRWRFRPGTKDGAPVDTMATIEVNFRLL